MSDPDLTLPTKINVNTVLTVVDGANYSFVNELFVTEIAGATPNVTVEVYDGTTSTYWMKTRQITALQSLLWKNIALSPVQKIRVTATAANQIDVIATVVNRKQQ